jgi:hypothetical protein
MGIMTLLITLGVFDSITLETPLCLAEGTLQIVTPIDFLSRDLTLRA